MDGKLNEQQILAVSLMAAGVKDVQVARQIGVHQSTIIRWKTNPLFMAALDEQLDRIQSEVARTFRSKATAAAKKITQLMDNDVSAHVQFQAAKEVLDRIDKAYEQRRGQKECDQGLSLWQVYGLIDDLAEGAVREFDLLIGDCYRRLGLVSDARDYLEWSDSRRAWTALNVDLFCQYLEGSDPANITIDQGLMEQFGLAWGRENDTERQWAFTLECNAISQDES